MSNELPIRSNSISQHIHPDHLILNIKSPSQPSQITRILPFKTEKRMNHIIKEKSRTFHNFSLKESPHPSSLSSCRLISNFKQLKALTCLNIDLIWLFYTQKSIIHLLFESLKHLKDLRQIHFHTDKLYTAFLGRNLKPLCQAISEIDSFPRLKVTLSLSISNFVRKEQLSTLLNGFTKLRCLGSIHLTFSHYDDISRIQQYITLLKTSKSLSQLNLTLDTCRFDDMERLQSLLWSLTPKGDKFPLV